MTDPHALFEAWLAEARASEPNDPEAMALATADAAGRPSVRMVLLKGHDARGFAFYTNEGSSKGADLAANPVAALVFHWKSLRRQVRVEGRIEPASAAEADAYFATRSRDARLGAWASDQSRSLESREAFEARYRQVVEEYEGRDVARPPYWGGYRLLPQRLEPPASGQVYALTEWGHQARPIMGTMGRWATRSPAHDPGQHFSAVSLMLSFQAMGQPALMKDMDACIGFRLGREAYVLTIDHGMLNPVRGDPAGCDLIFEGAPATLAAAVYGGVALAELEAEGALRIEGDRALAERFVTLFPLPPRAMMPAG